MNGVSSPVSAHSSGCPPVLVSTTRVWSSAEPRSIVVADKVNCPGRSGGGGGGGVGGGGVVATAAAVVSDTRRVSDTELGVVEGGVVEIGASTVGGEVGVVEVLPAA